MPQTQPPAGLATAAFRPDILLATKLYIPPPRPGSVARPHLVARLEAGLQRQPGLTLISAPPGFGKTTLLGQWIHPTSHPGLTPRPVGWVSLDEEDNRPRRFLAYGLAALRQIQPGIGHDALARLDDQTLTPQTFLTPLINEMMAIETPFIFVLDDYHVIKTPLIHQGLAFVLDHLPPQGQLIIASRTEPPFSLARLRARGQLTELTGHDLAFTPAETAEFLNRTMGLNLAPREIEALETRTEGWIAGLQMAALSMQGVQDTAGFVRAFTGSHRYILDYLMEEVLNRQSEPVQNFLLHTAILNRLTASLCDALLLNHHPNPAEARDQASEINPPNSNLPISNLQSPTPIINCHAVLDYLEQANLFIIPLDDERRWYRYHHLFADLLRDRLMRQFDPAAVIELHQRASDWFHQHGFAAEAMSHALAAVDTRRIVKLVREKAASLVSQGEFVAMLSWLEHLPPEMTRSWARVPLLPIWALVLTGELDTIEPRLQEVEQQLLIEPQAVGLERQRIFGETTAIRTFAAYFQRDMVQAIVSCKQALALLGGGHPFLQGILVQTLGSALSWSGRTDEAAEAFIEAGAINRTAENWEAVVMAQWSLASIRAEQGRLKQAGELYRQALTLAVSETVLAASLTPPDPGRIYLGLAELYYQQNELDQAQHQLDAGLETLAAEQDRGMLASAHWMQARLHTAQGRHDEARAAIDQAARLARQHPGPFYWAGQIATYQAALWLADGRVAAVQSWLASRELWPAITPFSVPYLREAEYLLLARFLLAHNAAPTGRAESGDASDLTLAAEILALVLKAAQENDRTGRVIETLVLQARLLETQDQLDKAMAVLGQALALAAPEGMGRVFIDEGEPLAGLLRQFIAGRGSTPQRAYALKLLAVFDAAETPASPLLDPLSERELEILRLTASGLSNKKLAETLILTVGTVKWHLNNIYSKLGVSSRTEAVARARELGLL
ncbi:MAG: hypothetical protein H6631_05515 [Anaerolineaceae bacterium]|nr:hypothetical protein [Anaerolineaceae bacterium]MCB9102357.1 hypothetical protein [Anaerolineales bacterium]